MEPQTPKATIPTSVWEPLHNAFTTLIEQMQQGLRESFSVSFEIDGFSPYPYIQASVNDDADLVIEFTSNVYLEPDLNRTQIARLDSIGWRKPNGRNPNYTKIVSGVQPTSSTARYITTTLRMVYQLDDSVWIVFGTEDLDKLVYQSDSFWHRLDAEGVVCFIGKNVDETIEGIS